MVFQELDWLRWVADIEDDAFLRDMTPGLVERVQADRGNTAWRVAVRDAWARLRAEQEGVG